MPLEYKIQQKYCSSCSTVVGVVCFYCCCIDKNASNTIIKQIGKPTTTTTTTLKDLVHCKVKWVKKKPNQKTKTYKIMKFLLFRLFVMLYCCCCCCCWWCTLNDNKATTAESLIKIYKKKGNKIFIIKEQREENKVKKEFKKEQKKNDFKPSIRPTYTNPHSDLKTYS